MILVTLGTHPQPMDRVVLWVDHLIEEGTIDKAVIQAACFGERPRRAEAIGVVAGDELEHLMKSATRVVTHGGPGTIIQALALGRRPIVVARDPALGEHIDGHQQRFVAWLAERRDILPVAALDDLRAALLEPEPPIANGLVDRRAVKRIWAILHEQDARSAARQKPGR